MAAAYGGHAEIVRALLARVPTVDAIDRLKKNAMTYAAGEGHTEIVQLLLARGVDPNAVYHNDLTALMWAAGYGRPRRSRRCSTPARDRTPRTIAARRRIDMAREGNHRGVTSWERCAEKASCGGSVGAVPIPFAPARRCVDERVLSGAGHVQRRRGEDPARRQVHVAHDSLSVGFFAAHAGSAMPKNLTG